MTSIDAMRFASNTGACIGTIMMLLITRTRVVTAAAAARNACSSTCGHNTRSPVQIVSNGPSSTRRNHSSNRSRFVPLM